MRILSGVQPSGKLHLGNYFGAVRQFLALQHEHDALYFVADWHALTSLRDGARLRELSYDVVLDYVALGLDPARATIFLQSHVAQHAELFWILSSVCPMGLLERGHSYKDKLARGAAPDVGLFTYPVLMASDILLYAATHVPVGQDQKQHLEMARDIATKFNVAFVKGYHPQDPNGQSGSTPGILQLPEPLILDEVAVVPGIDGQKMSKSYNNTLELFAPLPALRKKIMSIMTDSTPVDAPKPEEGPLLALLQLMAPAEEMAHHRSTWRAGGVGYGTYKQRLYTLMVDTFAPARARREKLAQSPQLVEALLQDGARRARDQAATVYDRVVDAVGCGRRLLEASR